MVEVYCDECGRAYQSDSVMAQDRYIHLCDDCIMIEDVFMLRTHARQVYLIRRARALGLPRDVVEDRRFE